jgi:hypothetical protein
MYLYTVLLYIINRARVFMRCRNAKYVHNYVTETSEICGKYVSSLKYVTSHKSNI